MSQDDTQHNKQHFVAKTEEIPTGKRVVKLIEGREIAVFNVDNDFYALLNYCPHMGGPVCEGELLGYFTSDEEGELEYDCEGEIITCPWHGWEFDVKSGHHLASSQYRLPTYDVEVIEDEIYVIV